VTAEGVETSQQRTEVVAFGCDAAQGYHYSRPMTADHFAATLEAEPSGGLHLPAEARA